MSACSPRWVVQGAAWDGGGGSAVMVMRLTQWRVLSYLGCVPVVKRRGPEVVRRALDFLYSHLPVGASLGPHTCCCFPRAAAMCCTHSQCVWGNDDVS